MIVKNNMFYANAIQNKQENLKNNARINTLNTDLSAQETQRASNRTLLIDAIQAKAKVKQDKIKEDKNDQYFKQLLQIKYI